MEFSPERDRIIEKMFDAALKEKMNLLARKYDHDLVFELWTRMAKTGCVKSYFCKWRWKPNMTIWKEWTAWMTTSLDLRLCCGNARQLEIADNKRIKQQKMESARREK